jgi:uridine monophosphate synthetase
LTISFFESLEQRCRQVDSLLCVGLDPHADELSQTTAIAARDFCLRLVEETSAVSAAFKPNIAFFEVFGAEGIQALQDVIAAVPDGIPVILDAKRGDIGTTAQAYAQAAFQTLGVHAITANPYLGSDSVAPLLSDPEKGVFLLCKTSNPGAGELQDQFVNGEPLYALVAQLAQSWNKSNNVGLVVGATYPEVLAELRELVPEMWILAPGIGAQGGELEATISAGLRSDGLGLLVPISRSISRAADPGKAAQKLRDQINSVRENQKNSPKLRFPHAKLADDLLKVGCVKFGGFKLKSGKSSPIYFDLRLLIGDPQLLARAASAYVSILDKLKFDRIAGLPYAALPIATAISMQCGKPMIYPRKETKEYGTKSAIEGPYKPGEIAVVIDDLITTGGSKLEGIEKLESAGLQVHDIVVLINRRAEPSDELAGRGVKLHSVFRIAELLQYWRIKGAITESQFSETIAFLQS